MVTGAIKNKVDKIWTDIWAGGITNPLTVIEQLTYLMFIRAGGVVCDLHQLTVFVKVRQTAILHLFDGREHPLLHGQENFAGIFILEAAPPSLNS